MCLHQSKNHHYMNHQLKVESSIDVQATPEKVWEALTNPEIIKEYLYGTNTITDWKVGSEIIFQGEYEGQSYKDKGVIREFDPLNKISYSYWSGFSGMEDVPENYSLVSYVVTPKADNLTTFTWIQQGFGSEAGYEHSKYGMNDFLQLIKTIMEKQ